MATARRVVYSCGHVGAPVGGPAAARAAAAMARVQCPACRVAALREEGALREDEERERSVAEWHL